MAKEEEIARFVAFCIECYKRRHGGNGEETFDLFSRTGVISFLSDCFDVEHCLDPDQITDDIDKIVQRKEVAQ